MSVHPITGVSRVTVGGEPRTLAFDMNCAAVLHEAKGEHWNQWLVSRFLGEQVAAEANDGQDARRVTPLTPGDTITALHALLASDREDFPREESERSLRRTVSPAEIMDLQLAMVRAVLAGFGLPGEFIEAVANAVDAPRAGNPAAGTGTKRLVSPRVPFRSHRTASGG